MELTFKEPDDNFIDSHSEPVYGNTASEAFDEDMGGVYASTCEPEDHESIPFAPDVSLDGSFYSSCDYKLRTTYQMLYSLAYFGSLPLSWLFYRTLDHILSI